MIDERKFVAELTVTAAQASMLEELAKQLGGTEVAFGPLRDVEADAQLYLDLGTVVEAVKSVTAVMSGAAGAAKLIEYLIALFKRSPKQRILVKVGSTTVIVTGNAPPDEIRGALRAALKLASP